MSSPSNNVNNNKLKNREVDPRYKKKVFKTNVQYKLTTKNEYAEIKEKLLTHIQNTDIKNTTLSVMLMQFQDDLNLRNTSFNIQQYNILINNIFATNKKYLLLCKYTTLNQIAIKYEKLSTLHKQRSNILNIILNEPTLPNTIRKNIKAYVSESVDAKHHVEPFYAALESVTEDQIETFNKSLKQSKEFNDSHKTFLSPIETPLIELLTSFINGFKRCYKIYKDVLYQYLSYIELSNNELYQKTKSILQDTVWKYLPPTLSQYLDHYYFLNLFRVYCFLPMIGERNPLPLFSDIELNQIGGYLSEIEQLLHLSIIFYQKNNKISLIDKIFSTLPVSRTINKKPAQFFGQPISKTTYSILLDYLNLVTMTLSNELIININNQLDQSLLEQVNMIQKVNQANKNK